MATSYSTIDNAEFTKMEKLDSTDLDWSTVNYRMPETSAFWWRIFIWVLTVIAIFGMAAALFWWQIEQGVGPSSTLSSVKIIQSTTPRSILKTIPQYKAVRVVQDFPKPHANGKYIVLAGSFIHETNARRIYDKLRQADIPVRSKQAMVNGQRHTHLLVGPYKLQDSAELAVTMIRKKTGLPVDYTTLGVEGEVGEGREVALFDALANNSALYPDQFIVLAGSFTTRPLAQRVKQRLQKKQILANIKEAHEQDRTFFHVMVGPYRLAIQANNMVETIRKKTGILAESTQIL
jgi:cell division septation protein DedD